MPDFRLNNDDIRFDFWRIVERRINDGKLSMDYWTLSIYQFAYVSLRRVVRRSHGSAWTEWLLMMLSSSFACGLPSMSLLQSSTQFSLKKMTTLKLAVFFSLSGGNLIVPFMTAFCWQVSDIKGLSFFMSHRKLVFFYFYHECEFWKEAKSF